MLATFARIAIVIAIGIGIYKFYPRLSPQVKQTLSQPKVLGESIVNPVVNSLNKVLPDQINLPTIKASPNSSSISSSSSNTALNSVLNDVKSKAGDIAQEQFDNLKKEAGKTFCQVIIKKIEQECGLGVTPTP